MNKKVELNPKQIKLVKVNYDCDLDNGKGYFDLDKYLKIMY